MKDWAWAFRAAALGLGLLALAACAPAAPPAQPTAAPPPAQPTVGPQSATRLAQPVALKFGVTGIAWSKAPQFVGIEKKFFEAENINLEVVAASQSAGVCQQLLAKAVDLGDCSVSDMMQAIEAGGAPLVLVGTELVTTLNYGLMTKPEIKTWADLKDRTIIVGGPKDNTAYFVHAMARPNGLKDEDYQFQFAGSSSARFAALKSGAVDAAMLTDPFDAQAEGDGLRRLDDLLPRYVRADTYSGGGTVANRDWAKEHPNEIAAYTRAIQKAIAWIYMPANKDELFTIMQPKLNVSREAYDRTYQKTVLDNKMWATDPHNIESAVQGVADSLVDLGTLNPPVPRAAKYFDNSFADLATR
jgi:NitT/TauT family transport system substrate-binding protein